MLCFGVNYTHLALQCFPKILCIVEGVPCDGAFMAEQLQPSHTSLSKMKSDECIGVKHLHLDDRKAEICFLD